MPAESPMTTLERLEKVRELLAVKYQVSKAVLVAIDIIANNIAVAEKALIELAIYQNSINSARDLVDIQCSDGNWDYDPYMQGMANGMIIIMSCFTKGEPAFKNVPEIWGVNQPDTDKPTMAGR